MIKLFFDRLCRKVYDAFNPEPLKVPTLSDSPIEVMNEGLDTQATKITDTVIEVFLETLEKELANRPEGQRHCIFNGKLRIELIED